MIGLKGTLMNDQTKNPVREFRQEDYPSFHASGVNLAVTSMDFRMVFTEQYLTFGRDGDIHDENNVKVKCVVSMNLHSAKDFLGMLGRAVADVESKFGVVDTPYNQALKAQEDKS